MKIIDVRCPLFRLLVVCGSYRTEGRGTRYAVRGVRSSRRCTKLTQSQTVVRRVRRQKVLAGTLERVCVTNEKSELINPA